MSHACRWWIVAVLVALPVVASPVVADARSLAEIKASGTLVVLAFPSLDNEFVHLRGDHEAAPVTGTTDDFAGIDVDLMQAFAEHLGVGLEIRLPMPEGESSPSFDELIPALLRSDGDVIASSFSITEARALLVDFSQPYYMGDRVVLARADDRTFANAQDVAGKTAAAVMGSSLESALRQLGVTRFVHVPRVAAALDAVRQGAADCTMVDVGAHEEFPESHALKEVLRQHEVDAYGIAVAPGSDLKPALDAFIEDMVLSGTLDCILERHLSLAASARAAD